MSEVAIALGFVGMSFILSLLFKSLNKIHEILKTFFFIMTILLLNVAARIAMVFGTGITGLTNTLRAVYNVTLWSFFLVTFYFVVFYFVELINKNKNKGKWCNMIEEE